MKYVDSYNRKTIKEDSPLSVQIMANYMNRVNTCDNNIIYVKNYHEYESVLKDGLLNTIINNYGDDSIIITELPTINTDELFKYSTQIYREAVTKAGFIPFKCIDKDTEIFVYDNVIYNNLKKDYECNSNNL